MRNGYTIMQALQTMVEWNLRATIQSMYQCCQHETFFHQIQAWFAAVLEHYRLSSDLKTNYFKVGIDQTCDTDHVSIESLLCGKNDMQSFSSTSFNYVFQNIFKCLFLRIVHLSLLNVKTELMFKTVHVILSCFLFIKSN